jgi:hypothetical protein
VKILHDKKGGVDQYLGALFAMLALIALFVALSAGMKAVNEYNTLNDFGSELAVTAGNAGCCSGDRVEARYNELVKATGLKPDVEYSAEYVDSSKRTVQYGGTITIKLSCDAKISALGISASVPLHITKTVESQQYWK